MKAPTRGTICLLLAVVAGCASPPADPQQAMAAVGPSLTAGTDEAIAVGLLRKHGFHCRELARSDWTHANPAVMRTLFCPARTSSAPGGFSVTYVTLGIDADGKMAEASSGSYGSGSVPGARQ